MRKLSLIMGLAVLVLAGLTFWRAASQPVFVRLTPQGESSSRPLDKLWTLPDFSLTDQHGQTVTLGELKGKIWVADFVYTTCPGPCPILSKKMSDLQRLVGSDPEIRLVSLSSDPQADTPAVLAEYAKRFGAGDHWIF